MATIDTAKDIVRTAQLLCAPMDAAPDKIQEFYDIGSAAFTQEVLDPLGMTPEQLFALITLMEQFVKLMSGEATAVSIYRINLNAVRRVSV